MVFTPIELTDENVQRLFYACVLEGKTANSVPASLYEEESTSKLYFDYDLLAEHEKAISYMFGQLKVDHLSEQKIQLPNLAIKYNEKSWVKNKASLMKFIYLGIVASQISEVSKAYQNVLNLHIKPTLSPLDPNFESWWAEHKSEWED